MSYRCPQCGPVAETEQQHAQRAHTVDGLMSDRRRRELLLGCGFRREKILVPPGSTSQWGRLITADINENCDPELCIDFEKVHWHDDFLCYGNTNIAKDSEFDEIHAYEVLEHFGQQGDYRSFFGCFETLWRLLKPDGYLCATTPSRYSPWLWGDPGHRRVVLRESLTFLSQLEYTKQIGVTPMSDYRSVYRADFDLIASKDDRVTHSFILKAIKPARI